MILLVAGCADVSEPTPPTDPVDMTDNGNGDGQPSMTPTEYFEQNAKLRCTQAYVCRDTYPGDAAAFEATWGTSVAECTMNLALSWNPMGFEIDVAKGRIEFDHTAAVACITSAVFPSCDEHWEIGIQWAEPCSRVMVGIVASGGSCETDYACTSAKCDAVTHTCK